MKLVDDPRYDLRYTQIEDEPYLKEWISQSEVLKWYPPSLPNEVSDFVKNWIGFSRFHASLTAIFQNTPCGIGTIFLMPYKKVIHLCLAYLIIAPTYQRKGIGFSLMRNLEHLAKNFFRLESMHLEVYEGCRVIPLLEKRDFKQIIRQERFIKEGDGLYRARLIYEKQL